MAKPAPRELEVIQSSRITPNMQRITLGGSAMAEFPSDQQSAYIKLYFPKGEAEKPDVRTYTIRHQRDGEIDVDFNLHDDGSSGPASLWARNTRPGDRILVGGPGPKKMINQEADWFLLVGDMTALPAISVNLAQLPEHAMGHAVIDVMDPADIQTLERPLGIQLHWLVNPSPDPKGERLVEHVRMLALPDGTPSVWAACEFSSMKQLRQHLREALKVPREQLYISSYWKLGQSEAQHKVTKSRDAEQDRA
ncbi:siderophore-interacting protein [Marinobacterium litorale]|uniref:siderophore-interacting protein n=1 Tax=Marinobacterium litorale TaxID=404770 RepID=UPI000424204F|nr:siderophore-interacting protein [Marinobacterium litorale]